MVQKEQNLCRAERRKLLPPCLQNNSTSRVCQRRSLQPPFISTLDIPVCSQSIRHTARIEHDQLRVDHVPFLPPARPFFRNIHHGQIQHLQQTVIRREYRFCLGHFPKLPVSGTYIRVHRKSLAKAKEKLKLLTKRNRGRNVRRVMQEVKEFIRGWIGYFRAADMKRT